MNQEEKFHFSQTYWGKEKVIRITDIKEKSMLYRKIIITVIIIGSINSFSVIYSQTFESARQKYEKKNYKETIKELKLLLKIDGNNFKASKLLQKAIIALKNKQSIFYTEKAVLEINYGKIKVAYKLLEKAIKLNPSNEKANKMFFSIHDVVNIEEKVKIAKKQKQEKKVQAEKKIRAIKIKEKRNSIRLKKILMSREQLSLSISSIYTTATSDNLAYANGDFAGLGLRLNANYYFNSSDKKFGIAIDYSNLLLKLDTNDDVNFSIHKIKSSLLYRFFVYEDLGGQFIIEPRINYQVFVLNNLKPAGIYNFKNIYGFSFGLKISDPILHHFGKNKVFENIIFEAEINMLAMPNKEAALLVKDFYAGLKYQLKNLQIKLGYHYFGINNNTVHETYNSIELGVGYKM